jgi:hypothetical protein
MLRRLLQLAFSIAVCGTLAMAQPAPNQVSNAEIIKMVRAGIDPNTIVWVIANSDGTKLDGSQAGLKALKAAGSPQAVLDAVTARTKKPAAMTAARTAPKTKRHPTSVTHGAGVGNALRNPATTARTLNQVESLQAETCEEGLRTVDDCHANHTTGCSKSENPRYDAYLNYLKNGMPDPSSTASTALNGGNPIGAAFFTQLESQIPDTLTATNHAQHAVELAQQGEGEIVTLVGTLFYTIHGGSETCNCQLSGTDTVEDFHIGVGFGDFPLGPDVLSQLRAGQAYGSILSPPDQHLLDQPSVVVEMTPYYREQFHPGWTLGKVASATGLQVKVTGQLMIDNVHHKPADDCGLADADMTTCWRASTWEVHPVTNFQVCSTDQCDPLSTTGWVNLEDR